MVIGKSILKDFDEPTEVVLARGVFKRLLLLPPLFAKSCLRKHDSSCYCYEAIVHHNKRPTSNMQIQYVQLLEICFMRAYFLSTQAFVRVSAMGRGLFRMALSLHRIVRNKPWPSKVGHSCSVWAKWLCILYAINRESVQMEFYSLCFALFVDIEVVWANEFLTALDMGMSIVLGLLGVRYADCRFLADWLYCLTLIEVTFRTKNLPYYVLN